MPNPAATISPTTATPLTLPASATLAAPTDRLTITPDRVLAPVGSEVVLRAGICVREGHLLANQRVEWTLSDQGVGQFVTLNSRGWLHPFRWPWNTPRLATSRFAIGATADRRHE